MAGCRSTVCRRRRHLVAGQRDRLWSVWIACAVVAVVVACVQWGSGYKLVLRQDGLGGGADEAG